MLIDNSYQLKDIVFLLTDPDQYPRLVVAIQVCIDGSLLYRLSCGTNETVHYEAEITSEKNLIIAM